MKEKKWESHVRAQLKSGLSQQAYCRRHGLKAGTFGYWSSKLRKKDSSENSGGFAEVGVSAPLEIIAGGITIRVPRGYDVEELVRLVEGLSC